MRFVWIFALALAGVARAEGERPRFQIETTALDAGVPALKGPFIALVWKSDCGPCLTELGYFAALQAASGGHLVTVALDAPDLARATLTDNAVPAHAAYVASGDPRAVLAGLSGGQTRLPLSVAVSASGEICASHVGLLGADMARSWSQSCLK